MRNIGLAQGSANEDAPWNRSAQGAGAHANADEKDEYGAHHGKNTAHRVHALREAVVGHLVQHGLRGPGFLTHADQGQRRRGDETGIGQSVAYGTAPAERRQSAG